MNGGKKRARLGRPARVSGEASTKERIFEAAVGFFARQGYDRTSIRQIAGALGLTESAVYRHYPSKDSILGAIIDYAERWVTEPPPGGEAGGPSIFRRMLESLPRAMAADPYLVSIVRVMYAEMHHDERIRAYLRDGLAVRAVDAVEEQLRREARGGARRGRELGTIARIFNSFRAEWLFETYVLDRGADHDPVKLAEDLREPIEFFEGLLDSGSGRA
jgi:AcrR family transcriptional regulator